MRRFVRLAGIQIVIIIVTLGVIELILRVTNPRIVRQDPTERSQLYAHDDELGWYPVPNSSSTFTVEHTITARHNSLGLRDIELDAAKKPTIMVVGDSFTWGYEVEAEDRVTDVMRRELPDYKIVNAGVAGYGTDQEFLLLKRLWDRVSPDVVVLSWFFNDIEDNTHNLRYNGAYKPYYDLAAQKFLGQPVPKSRHWYSRNNWIARNFLLARLVLAAYVPWRYPEIKVPDPTAQLFAMTREFVESHGAKFFVATFDDPTVVGYLQAQKIPYVLLNPQPDSTDFYFMDNPANGPGHWNPRGHARAAELIMRMLADGGVLKRPPASDSTVQAPKP